MSKWFLEQRQNYISEHLQIFGEINRKDIMEKFDVSVAVSSCDLKKYQDKNPNKIYYDKNKKKYILNKGI